MLLQLGKNRHLTFRFLGEPGSELLAFAPVEPSMPASFPPQKRAARLFLAESVVRMSTKSFVRPLGFWPPVLSVRWRLRGYLVPSRGSSG